MRLWLRARLARHSTPEIADQVLAESGIELEDRIGAAVDEILLSYCGPED